MKMRRWIAALWLLGLSALPAFGQGTVLQGGPWQPGHVPQYVGQGSSQAVVQDGGGAGGGAVGVNPAEIGITARGSGAVPYVGQGSGPFGTIFCANDAPINNPTGYHFICLSPNAQGGGLIAYGAGGIAAPLPLQFNVNGVFYPFPGVAPPVTSAPSLDPGGRLTALLSTPVPASSVVASTFLYYAPYKGVTVPLYTAGTGMRPLPFTASDTDTVGLTLTLGSNWASGSIYDAYAYVNGSQAGLCSSPDWATGAIAGSNAVGASFRGAGAGSAEQQLFKGFFTNKNAMTCRTSNAATVSCAVNECTFLGSFLIGIAGQTNFVFGAQGVAGNFAIWNAFNQKMFCSTSADPTLANATTSATPHQINGSAINQFNFLTGAAAGSIDGSFAMTVNAGNGVVGALASLGLALNSTAAFDKQIQLVNPTAAALNTAEIVTNSYPGRLGANFISANIASDGTNVSNFFGQNFMSLRVCLEM